MLEGKDKQWSAWTKESKKEYSELFEGKYIFKVKSKNLYGIESKEATFEFTVLPPWFRTWWAILIWAGLLAFFIWLIIILNHKRLIAIKRRLEIIVKERTKEIIHQKEIIEEEKVKSDNLLLNILPAEVAEELKQTGKSKAKSYESVSVLFIDIKDFTKISASQTPERIVADIDQCFRGFDDIVQKYGLEKIKTIGDAYMCAGGLPMKNSTHPVDIVNAALEIRDFIENLKKEKMKNNESYFDVRIGISSGPVVAGIVGNKKFAYDIWGDTVNTASRMETNGEIGKVNISNSTFELIKDKFKCTHRGKMPVKNKGDVDMYFVDFKI
jgi:class 3 adenylate cyclase